MSVLDFTCWHCGSPQIATENNVYDAFARVAVGKHSEGESGLRIFGVRCLKKECNKLNLSVMLRAALYGTNTGYYAGETLETWRLLPESTAVPQPACVPEQIAKSYYQACRIADLSPEASATLSRRCLQGMIRDFCQISKPTLAKEIEALKAALESGHAPKGVSEDSIEALDAIRSVGNIGAHMEKDINLIVDVDPDEARILLGVIEQLFVDWYVEREKRQVRFASARALADQKAAQKNP